MWLVGKRKTHLGKYFNCLLRFGAHHKRSICAPQSRVKGETQMVLRTKQWKLIHELGKVKPISLTIYLLCVYGGAVWVYRPVWMLLLLYMGGLLIVQIDLQHWSCTDIAPKTPERTGFSGQPVKCAMNTSVCLSLQGSDISMSLHPSFYESVRLVVRYLGTQHTGQKKGRVRLPLHNNVLNLWPRPWAYSCHEEK